MSAQWALAEAARNLAMSESDTGLAEVVRAARGCMDPAEVASLARVLAESGAQLEASAGRADVVSTGGAGSLSTLLAPSMLVASGYECAKVGVPGRPAGALDVLGSIPGFRVALSPQEARACLARAGQVHVAAGGPWAPLDGVLFSYRQTVGAQAIPALVAGSILAKKLAAGAGTVVLEQRIFDGANFGSSPGDAASARTLFIDAANCLGITAQVVQVESSAPRQPYLGRGESILALDSVFGERTGPWLGRHVREIERLCVLISGGSLSREPLAWRSAFLDHLAAQGVSVDSLRLHIDRLRGARRVDIRAERDGVVAYNTVRIRDALVAAQRGAPVARGAVFADPAGVVLKVESGSVVSEGETVLRVRVSEDASLDLVSRIKLAVCVFGDRQ